MNIETSIEDLIDKIDAPELRARILDGVSELKHSTRFGLVFEAHEQPETVTVRSTVPAAFPRLDRPTSNGGG